MHWLASIFAAFLVFGGCIMITLLGHLFLGLHFFDRNNPRWYDNVIGFLAGVVGVSLIVLAIWGIVSGGH